MSVQQDPPTKAQEELDRNHQGNPKDPPTNQVISDDDNSSIEDIDGDYGSYGNHIFSDPKVAEYWRHVYEKATYEGRHRFDPTFTWSAAEEKRLKRKACFTITSQLSESRKLTFVNRSTFASCHGVG